MYHVIMQKREKHERGIAVTTVRGVIKYCANVTLPNKKRKKAYFDRKEDARAWLKQYRMSVGVDLSDFAILTPNQLADIRLALKKLPEGYSLTRCVELVSQKYISTRSLSDCIVDFKKLKDNAGLSKRYLGQIKTRVGSLSKFRSFDEISAEKLLSRLEELKNRKDGKLAPKTRKHYLSAWSEFFDWCETRGYIKETPFRQIHSSDMPKFEDKNPQAASVEVIKEFFAEAEKVCPQFVGIFALTAFGGWRAAEAERMRPANFDFERKTISLAKNLTKTRENYGNLQPKDKGQANYPDNLWEWLKAYPPSEKWTEYDKYWYCVKIKTSKDIPFNGLRHSFATYHMSLYQNSELTKNLMHHHLNSSELWNHYMAGFVKPDIAQTYFSILPNLPTS